MDYFILKLKVMMRLCSQVYRQAEHILQLIKVLNKETGGDLDTGNK